MIHALAFTMSAYADEPNEDFNSATVLARGVLSVLDELIASGELNPDTILGNRDQLGNIEFVDDDSSPYGDGLGSALYGVPTNSGSIDFAVTGYGDFDFLSEHLESGDYEVFVDVYDFSAELIDSSSGSQLLIVGFVDEFSYFDAAWIGGSYDVYIDNGPPTDIDFFTFTELTPGTPFAARTSDPDELEIDTLLGWFNSLGELIEVDDDDAGGLLSLIQGVVPEEGELTFAVTGYGDDEFIGQHSQGGAYGLALELNPGSGLLNGDYNGNDVVDAADYTVWRDALAAGSTSLANDPTPGVVDESDFLYWVITLAPCWTAARVRSPPSPNLAQPFYSALARRDSPPSAGGLGSAEQRCNGLSGLSSRVVTLVDPTNGRRHQRHTKKGSESRRADNC